MVFGTKGETQEQNLREKKSIPNRTIAKTAVRMISESFEICQRKRIELKRRCWREERVMAKRQRKCTIQWFSIQWWQRKCSIQWIELKNKWISDKVKLLGDMMWLRKALLVHIYMYTIMILYIGIFWKKMSQSYFLIVTINI